VQGVIDNIWKTYDVDKSGALDKEEARKYIQDTTGDVPSQEVFDAVFSTFDKDNSGTIEKAEMVVFIKQLLGGDKEPPVVEKDPPVEEN
jgi:Ca2+-binding EF-hand superfamily protein